MTTGRNSAKVTIGVLKRSPLASPSYSSLSSSSSSSSSTTTTLLLRGATQRRLQSSKSMLDNVADFWSQLRFNAATALTSSLTAPDREKLLRSIGAVDEEQAREYRRKSVGEAVADALRREAEKNEQEWEREREEIIVKAETAARDRVESDLVVQERRLGMERLQRELDEAKLRQEDHPVLGQVLLDLGYKRIHLISNRALSAIPVWEKQRVYRHDRAKFMANDKLRSTHIGLPGVIALYEAEDGQLSIIDGQHRVGMMAILEQYEKSTDELGFDMDQVLVEVFPHRETSPSTLAQDIFTEINKAEPIKLVDMPGVAKSGDRKIINEAVARLGEEFPDMFKPSQKCRPPHLNVDNLRDALFGSDVLKRNSIKSKTALYNWMVTCNEELAVTYSDEESAAVKNANATALSKARKHNFYLGLDLSWLYR